MSKEKTIDNNHKCFCEKCICGCESKQNNFCVNMDEWFEGFETYPNGRRQGDTDGGGLCCVICCPIKFPFLLLCLPFTFYNICRYKCNNTEDKNYLC